MDAGTGRGTYMSIWMTAKPHDWQNRTVDTPPNNDDKAKPFTM